ncbi:MAG: fumarylacetoacetate hydrolase family protein [Actinomycetota bacterium]
MRLATVRTPWGTRAGRFEGDEIILLQHPDVGALLATEGWRAAASRADGRRVPAAGADLAPLVPRPPKIICLGMNYKTHVEEMGREVPSHPTLFAKYARSLVGPRDPIHLPPESEQVDWEVELAFVIGTETRRASPSQAGAAIAGFCALNDVSMRDWQFRTMQFLQGKTWERSTPLGPALVTPDELGGTTPDLALGCQVDGVTMQDARTSDLLFGPEELVAYISTIVTLEPGDVIATGTPGGVGAGRTPPVFLKPGQTVRTWIEDIGELVNGCISG